MGKTIGLTFDLKTDWKLQSGDPIDANAEFDGPKTVESIIDALESGGHKTRKIGNVKHLMSWIDDLDVDLVFNICEGRQGRNRESQVPLLLEMHGIPYVGSDALTMGVTLDKIVAKKCFIADGVPTARYFKADAHDDLKKLSAIGYPLIVKTLHEGTSKGLTNKSRVENFEQLKKQVEHINKNYKQPALVEEFISGFEFTVPVLGNRNPEAMPVIQYMLSGKEKLGDTFYTFQHVVEKSIEYVCPAKISPALAKKLQEIAVKAYQSVGCRDFGRVDFRVDEKGNPYVLEINPLPNLSKEDAFGQFPKVIGLTYEAVVNKIVDFALERQGLLGQREAANRK